MKNFIAIATMLASTTIATAERKPALAIQVSEVKKWEQPFGPQGPSFGYVVGAFGTNRATSFFIKLPAGFNGDGSGWHTHDEDYEGVVLKGTATAQQQGDAAETRLPVGTFFSQPGKQAHRNGCLKDGGECLMFLHFEHGASFHAATADGRLLPEPRH